MSIDILQKWDRCLCETDSDGDGKTNGEELGDPLCTWSPGNVPTRTTAITHPGVCEPLEDPICVKENEKLGDFCNVEADRNPCLDDLEKQRNCKLGSILSQD